MRKLALWMVMMLSAVGLMADVAIENIKVRQRWPWNGLVDITYDVVSYDALNGYDAKDRVYLFFVGKDNVKMRRVEMTTLTGDGVWGTTVRAGSYHTVWNMSKDYPGFYSSDFTVTIIPCKTMEYEHYLVIDVSGGANAVTYPYRYSTAAPSVTSAADKQSNIWLRYIPTGTFMYQGTTSKTISRGFYMGVFEITQGQYEAVMGTNPCSNTNYGQGASVPVYYVSYDMIRGNNWGREYGTDANSGVLGIEQFNP